MPNEPAEPAQTIGGVVATALRKGGIVGIDEPIEQPMLNDAFDDLNDLMAQWARSRYLTYRLDTYVFNSTGADTYAVGLGQTVNLNPRPDRLESAFLRLLPQEQGGFNVDIGLDIIPSKENYNQIALKKMGTISRRIFYDPIWPVGALLPWPIPQAGIYSIGVTFKQTLGRFANFQQQINLPPEYIPALKWCGAEVLRASYQLPPDPMIAKFARRALNAIRLANVAIPVLGMPGALQNRQRAYSYQGADEV